jgi:hypothetical protein
MESGTIPVREFSVKYILFTELISPSVVGRLPVSELSLNLTTSTLVKEPIDAGIVPTNSFTSK